MIKLTFTQYREKLENDRKTSHPTEHVMEKKTLFVLFFKSLRERIEYYTIIEKSEIESFSSIQEFKIDYCSNCLPVEDIGIFIAEVLDEDLNELMEDESSEYKETSLKKGFKEDIDEIVKNAKNYNDFLSKMFDNFENQAIKAIKQMPTDKYGVFISNLFNSINTLAFMRNSKRFLKFDLELGKNQAEDELNVKVPFNEPFEKKLNKLNQEQLNGYTINGKLWPGIKGVTKEIQQKVIKSVQDGVKENKSNEDIIEGVKKTFNGFSDHRAQMIARTETNRIINEGKILGYKESGIEGGKVYKVQLDDRTSPICERLMRKYGNNPIPLDEPFIDDKTNISIMTPPAHPNCRSTLLFRPL